ncbi:coiled-coil domain-containing protein 71 [Paroedura picta]|uniref:coiled-coil domain-containing protein 71 n=1 Tax=Paroedura picta TaxID=143630 RepID=UPI001013FB39
MNVAADNVEEKAVHSWSRISSAGQKALEEALRVFNPMSKDLSDTETQLVAFLQGLREEGYQPTILRSKDVYGYSSCTASIPNHQVKGSSQDSSKIVSPLLDSVKASARSTVTVAKLSAPLAGITVSSPKDPPSPLSKNSNSTNLLLNSLKRTRSGTSEASTVGFPANMYPGVYPAMRLSVVLEALVPLKATASCLESRCKQGHLGISPSDLKLLKAANASRQLPAKATKMSPGQLDPKSYRHIIKKVPDSAALTVTLLKGPKGGVLRESNACKASGILNGRISGSTSQSCSAGASRTKEPSVGKTDRRAGGSQEETVGQKRKNAEDGKELSHRKKPNSIPSSSQPELTSNTLKFRTIKVDSSSDDELRRRAQKILRVNLSPVIRIQPLPGSHSVP